jgi:urease accessory protein
VRADDSTTIPADWLLWQLIDSAFPIGGFAHSGGLEAAFHGGEVCGRDDLLAFLEAALWQSGSASVPFVAAAFDREKPFANIDAFCDAFISNHIANRASRRQGQSFLISAERAFCNSAITALRHEVRDLPGHFAPAFGAVASVLGLDRNGALRLFIFNQLRGWISSAVRLGIVGPMEGQSIQARLAPTAERAMRQFANQPLEKAAQTAPLIELFQGMQDRLYSRLFQS